MDTREIIKQELGIAVQGVAVEGFAIEKIIAFISPFLDRAYEVGRTEGYTAGLAEQVGGEEE